MDFEPISRTLTVLPRFLAQKLTVLIRAQFFLLPAHPLPVILHTRFPIFYTPHPSIWLNPSTSSLAAETCAKVCIN